MSPLSTACAGHRRQLPSLDEPPAELQSERRLGSFGSSFSGSYQGSIIENDGGFVDVTVEQLVSFKGGVEEFGGGDVTAEVNGLYEGNLAEYANGNVLTSGSGTFKGNSEHELPGTCTHTIIDFQGSVCNLL